MGSLKSKNDRLGTKECSQKRSQIVDAMGQKLPSVVATCRGEILLQKAPRTVDRRPVALPVASGQMVGVVRFELTTSTSRT